MRKKIVFLIIFVLFILCGCNIDNNTSTTPTTLTDFYFDTVVTITIYDGTAKKDFSTIINTCFDKCKDFENIISKTVSDSDTSKINNSYGTPVKISTTESELIEKGLYYSSLTNGVFDITINPISSLWNFGHKNSKIPDIGSINSALQHVNYKNVILNENDIYLKDSNASIDLGGIAKGYIADELKEYMIGEGITSAIINLGGNILTIGGKPDGSNFKIGITKPFYDNEYSVIVNINDKSVVTSGVYERYFYNNDTLYHHIIDTTTGMPCNNGLYSVSIISDYSVDGDALSTSCFLLGLEKGMELIDSLNNTEAIFIDENYEIFLSSGLTIDSNSNISIKGLSH